DEPTNDLDIHTLNLLEEFLMNFEGCLLVVSHDRFFMDKLVDHVFVFEGEGKIKDFYGNYTEYYRNRLAEEARLNRQKLAEVRPEVKKQPEKPLMRKPTYKEKTEFESLEKDIAHLETLKAGLLEKMNSGAYTPAELEQISRNYGIAEAEIEEKTNR
ncbi:MAG TPA: ABC transporter, partial [Bacteroidales bacterium]|nr:ABC transporter [Bacteroidales bacterium]